MWCRQFGHEILSGHHRSTTRLRDVLPRFQRDSADGRTVRTGERRTQHQYRRTRIRLAHLGGDVAQRSVDGRVGLDDDDLQVDAVLAGLGDHLPQSGDIGTRGRTHSAIADLRLDHGHVHVGRNVARQVREFVRSGHTGTVPSPLPQGRTRLTGRHRDVIPA